MRERPLPLRELREANDNLWDTGRIFGEQSIRGEPRGSSTLLRILAESNVNGIVVFGDIPTDVVETPVPDLNINIALEYRSEKLDECRYDGSTSPASK